MSEEKPVYITHVKDKPASLLLIQMDDGTYVELLDYVTLVKLVYILRDMIVELEAGRRRE